MQEELKKLRDEIDKIDEELLGLINKRLRLAQEIGKLKRSAGEEFFAPEREKKILQRLTRLNTGPLNEQALRAIFREIISATRLYQKGLSIAYWGPAGSFTHQAAVEKFGSMAEYIPEPSIQDVFQEVGKGRADYGVVPIENSMEGVVNYTLDMFVDSPLKICAEIYLEISHYLMGRGKLEDIKCIYSNPQAIAQCRQWIRQNLPHAELIEVSTTSKGAELAARDATGTSAAIGSKIAAEIYNLKILASNIEDSARNITRFLIIGKNYSKPSGNDKTSIMFSIKDEVGALYNMLQPFKKYGINLTKIESRPSRRKAWDYYFFVDFQGHCEEEHVKKALSELERSCVFLKLLGSYPAEEVGDGKS